MLKSSDGKTIWVDPDDFVSREESLLVRTTRMIPDLSASEREQLSEAFQIYRLGINTQIHKDTKGKTVWYRKCLADTPSHLRVKLRHEYKKRKNKTSGGKLRYKTEKRIKTIPSFMLPAALTTELLARTRIKNTEIASFRLVRFRRRDRKGYAYAIRATHRVTTNIVTPPESDPRGILSLGFDDDGMTILGKHRDGKPMINRHLSYKRMDRLTNEELSTLLEGFRHYFRMIYLDKDSLDRANPSRKAISVVRRIKHWRVVGTVGVKLIDWKRTSSQPGSESQKINLPESTASDTATGCTFCPKCHSLFYTTSGTVGERRVKKRGRILTQCTKCHSSFRPSYVNAERAMGLGTSRTCFVFCPPGTWLNGLYTPQEALEQIEKVKTHLDYCKPDMSKVYTETYGDIEKRLLIATLQESTAANNTAIGSVKSGGTTRPVFKSALVKRVDLGEGMIRKPVRVSSPILTTEKVARSRVKRIRIRGQLVPEDFFSHYPEWTLESLSVLDDRQLEEVLMWGDLEGFEDTLESRLPVPVISVEGEDGRRSERRVPLLSNDVSREETGKAEVPKPVPDEEIVEEVEELLPYTPDKQSDVDNEEFLPYDEGEQEAEESSDDLDGLEFESPVVRTQTRTASEALYEIDGDMDLSMRFD